MDSLSNLISILQTNQTHKNSHAIIPYSKFSQAFLTVLRSERLINGYTIKYTTDTSLAGFPASQDSDSNKQMRLSAESCVSSNSGRKYTNDMVTLLKLAKLSAASVDKSQVQKSVIGNENYRWKKKFFLVFLKYDKRVPGVQRCIRISTPGRRVYCNTNFLKKNTKGFDILFLSTSYGIISHRKAKALGVGGELLCKILL